MPAYTRSLGVRDADHPAKIGAMRSLGQSMKPQTRNVLATKRSWTEYYAEGTYTVTVKNWLNQIYTWWNEGTLLTVVHPDTGESISAYIWEIRQPKIGPTSVVGGLQVEFREA